MNKYLDAKAVVLAIAGREKGEIFLVVSADSNYAYLVNGTTRTIENPKKKNKKHLHLLCKSVFTDSEMKELNDAQVKKFLNNYNKSRVK